MLNSEVSYRVTLARIDDLRLQAEQERIGKLVSGGLGRRHSRRAGRVRRGRVPRLSYDSK